MLLQRILTAVPLGLFVIWIILFQPSDIFLYLLLVIALLAAYEWAQLGGLVKVIHKAAFAIMTCGISWLLIDKLGSYVYLYVILAASWWFASYLFLRTVSPVNRGVKLSAKKLSMALLVIPAAVVAMYAMHLQNRGDEWLLYGLALVWVADIGAYFSGKAFGKTKLAPAISPGKTLQGLWGGMIATALYTIIASNYFSLDMKGTIILLLLSQLLTLVSVSGDLYESYLKRERGIKDSGRILPGHGGILDRIDSVLAAMPVFLVGFDQFIKPLNGIY